MIPDKAPEDDVFHGGEEMRRGAHVPTFEKFKEMYMQSIEDPDSKCDAFDN